MNAVLVINSGVTSVTAMNLATNQQIAIAINEEAVEGSTYNLGLQQTNIGAAVYTIGNENSFGSLIDGGNGTITFTTIDEENGVASGTFSFLGVRETLQNDGSILVETANITNGEFK